MHEGLFEHHQRIYAEYGIVTFPVRPDKTPAVRNYLKLGPKGSARLVDNFGDASAIGLACQRNRITVLDVDATDERVLGDGLQRFGPTPFIVRTGSGHFQAWYRHNGERRLIRPEPGIPIDILGDGFVVAPPSQANTGTYQIIQGSLDDLAALPVMRRVPQKQATIDPGRRNAELFSYCLKTAGTSRTRDDLTASAMRYSETAFSKPLPDEEVLKVVASAWCYESEGNNWVGKGQRVAIPFDVIDGLAAEDPKAFALYSLLKRHHSGSASFVIANAYAVHLGWDGRAFRAARDTLVDRGLLACVHKGGRGKHDPSQYRFSV